MSRTHFMSGAALGAAMALSAMMIALAPSQDATSVRPVKPKQQDATSVRPKQEQPHAEQAMPPEMQAMMDGWMKYMTPGKEHENLLKMAGTWNLGIKMWWGPDAPAEQSTAVSTFEPAFGGRYLIEKTVGNEPGPNGDTFRGMGIMGYDNMLQKYVGAWIDNMGTGIARSEGVATDASGKNFRFDMVTPDLVNGGFKMERGEQTCPDDNTMIFKMWSHTPDGTEYLAFEAVYKRQPGKAATSAAGNR